MMKIAECGKEVPRSEKYALKWREPPFFLKMNDTSIVNANMLWESSLRWRLSSLKHSHCQESHYIKWGVQDDLIKELRLTKVKYCSLWPLLPRLKCLRWPKIVKKKLSWEEMMHQNIVVWRGSSKYVFFHCKVVWLLCKLFEGYMDSFFLP